MRATDVFLVEVEPRSRVAISIGRLKRVLVVIGSFDNYHNGIMGEVTRLFNEAGLTISASTVYAIQSQRDDREVGRPNARKIRPLPAWANFKAVGVRGERESK